MRGGQCQVTLGAPSKTPNKINCIFNWFYVGVLASKRMKKARKNAFFNDF